MSVVLSNVTRKQDSAPALVAIESVEYDGRTLAVCDRNGEHVLAVARERAVKDDNGKPTGERESVLRPTALLADFADAMTAGLIE